MNALNYYCCAVDYNIEEVGRFFSISWAESPYVILDRNIHYFKDQLSELISRHYEEINLTDYGSFTESFPELGINCGEDEFNFAIAGKAILKNLKDHLIYLKEIAPEGLIGGLWYDAIGWLREEWLYDTDYFDIPFEGLLQSFVPALINYFDCSESDGVFDFYIGQHQATLQRIIKQDNWIMDRNLINQIFKEFEAISRKLSDF